MIIQINPNCRLESDSYNWCVQVPAKDGWASKRFYRYLDQAIAATAGPAFAVATVTDIKPFLPVIELVTATEALLLTLETLDLSRAQTDELLYWFAVDIGIPLATPEPRAPGAIEKRNLFWASEAGQYMTVAGGAVDLFHRRLRLGADQAEIPEICAQVRKVGADLPQKAVAEPRRPS